MTSLSVPQTEHMTTPESVTFYQEVKFTKIVTSLTKKFVVMDLKHERGVRSVTGGVKGDA